MSTPPPRRPLQITAPDEESALILCRAGAALGDAERPFVRPDLARPLPDLPPRPSRRRPTLTSVRGATPTPTPPPQREDV